MDIIHVIFILMITLITLLTLGDESMSGSGDSNGNENGFMGGSPVSPPPPEFKPLTECPDGVGCSREDEGMYTYIYIYNLNNPLQNTRSQHIHSNLTLSLSIYIYI